MKHFFLFFIFVVVFNSCSDLYFNDSELEPELVFASDMITGGLVFKFYPKNK